MVKTVIAVAILTLMLSSGFVLVTYDRADEGVKILSDDDYVEMEQELVAPSITERWDSVERFSHVNDVRYVSV